MLEDNPITSFSHVAKHYAMETALVYFADHSEEINNLPLLKMSYQALDTISTQLACQLQKFTQPGDVVCVLLPQSHYYIIAMLACWKAGVVYMPVTWNGLDSDQENISAIQTRLSKVGVKLIVSCKSYQDKTKPFGSNCPIIDIENRLELPDSFEMRIACQKSDLAYIICSSGTSGTPKIIDVPFVALMKRIKDAKRKLDINCNDHMLALLNFAFDASIMEILIALTEGIPLILAPEQVRRNIPCLGQLFQRLCEEDLAITTAIFIPKILNRRGRDAFSPSDFPGLKKFLSTGEAFSHPEMLSQWFDAGIRVFNGYGPTETTFGAIITELKRNEDVPIYQSHDDVFHGLSLLRLAKGFDATDEKWRLAETGNAMLFIAGEGLAHYHDSAELNEKYFIKREDYGRCFDNEVIQQFDLAQYPLVYKTFDIVCTDANSKKIVFQYRDDRIIKVLGGQVNLDAIEKYFTEKFKPALVIYHEDNIKVFFRHANPSDADIVQLKKLLAETESKLLANAYFWFKDSDTSAHKTNRKPDYLLTNAKRIVLEDHEQYFTPTEKKIAAIWHSLVQHAQLFKTCDFKNHLGADSLILMQMVNRIWIELINNKEQPTVTVAFSGYIWEHRTLEQIAKFIDVMNMPCFQHSPIEQQAYYSVFYFGEIASFDGLKKTFLKRNHIQYTGDAVALNETQIINTLRRIRLIQANGPYLFVCLTDTYQPLCTKLVQQFGAHNETATIIKNIDQLEVHLTNQAKISLLNKIKKAQAYAMNSQLPALAGKEYVFTSGKTTWLLGDSCSGKTTVLQHLLKTYWEKFEKNQAAAELPIYFSLQGGQSSAVNDWLTITAKLNDEELKLLNTFSIIFLLDDYDLLNREDFPNLRLSNPVIGKHTAVIACRNRHMLDERCWGNMRDDDKLPLPAVEKSIAELFAHEKKRLKTKQLDLLNLHQLLGKVFSLNLMPSIWEPSQYKKNAMSYLHNYPFANFIRELLVPLDAGSNLYKFPDHHKLPTLTLTPAMQIDQGKSITLDASMEESLVRLVENNRGKPIFAFSPLTGDVPNSYRKLSGALGIHQPFYVLQLSKLGVDRTDNIKERAAYYAKIIQAIYPQGNLILLGWSFGVMQAYAVAKELYDNYQREIDLLINIDCPSPISLARIDRLTCAKDMVAILSKEIYRSEIGPINDDDITTIFNNAIILADKKNKSLANALRNAHLNFTAYTEFNRDFHESLQVPMLIFQAGIKHRSINEKTDYQWQCKKLQNVVVENADHFNIVVNNIVVARLQDELSKLQPHVAQTTLLSRLQNYAMHTLRTLESVPSLIDLELKNIARRENVQLTQLFLEFLADKKTHNLVICGEAGAGKTASFKNIQRQLLMQFDTIGFLPIYFNCRFTEISDITTLLLSAGFSMQEVATCAYKKILFLVDGFDECKQSMTFLNLIISLNQYGKVAVNVRNYIYDTLSNPNQFFGEHKKYDLLPLNTNQIQTFINDPVGFAYLMTLFQFGDLLKNPLTLNLIKNLLPEIRQRDNTKILSRYELYQLMFDKLFHEKVQEVVQATGIRPSVSLLAAFKHFAQSIAVALWQDEACALPNNNDTQQVLRACLLTQENNRLRFQHFTYHEFFVAQAIIDELRLFCMCPDSYQPNLMAIISLKQELSLLKFITEAIQSLDKDRYMVMLHHLWMIAFTTRWVRNNDKQKSAVGNALTILNTLMPMSGFILNNIQAQQANLECAILDNTKLEYAELEETNFARILMNRTSLHHTHLNRPYFGEYPALSFTGGIDAIACAPDDDRIAMVINDSISANEDFELPARANVRLTIWDSKQQLQLIEMPLLRLPSPESLAFSKDGKVLLSLSKLETRMLIVHYDSQTLNEINVYELLINTTAIKHLQVIKNNLLLFYADKFEIWSLEKRMKQEEHPLPFSDYLTMVLSGDGMQAVFQIGEKECAIVNLSNNQIISRMTSDNEITGMAFIHGQSNLILIGHKDTSLGCYDISNTQLVRQLYSNSFLHCLYTHPNGFIFNLAVQNDFFDNKSSMIETYQLAISKKSIFQSRNKLALYGKLHPCLPIIASDEQGCILLTDLANASVSRKIVMQAPILSFCFFNNEIYILDNTGLLRSFDILSGQPLTQYVISSQYINQFLNDSVSLKMYNGFAALYNPQYLLICSLEKMLVSEPIYTFDMTVLYPENVTKDTKHFNIFIQWVELLDKNHALVGVHIVHHHSSGCVDFDEYSIVLEWTFKTNDYKKVIEKCDKNIEDVYHDYPSFFDSCNNYIIMRHGYSIYFYDRKTYGLLYKYRVGDIHDLILINYGKQLALCDENSQFYIYNVYRHNDDLSIELADTCSHRGLFYHDEHYGVDSLSYNHQLNLFYACSPSMGSLWHIDTSAQSLSITLLQDSHYHLSCSDLLLEGLVTDNITQRLLEESDTVKNKTVNQVQCVDIKSMLSPKMPSKKKSYTSGICSLPEDIYIAHIFNHLSYHDRLVLSRVNHYFYQLTHHEHAVNHYGPLLPTAVINRLKNEVYNYFKRLFINNFQEPPNINSMQIKPDKQSPSLVKLGFFAPGHANVNEFKVPLLWLTNLPIQDKQNIRPSTTDQGSVPPVVLGRGCA